MNKIVGTHVQPHIKQMKSTMTFIKHIPSYPLSQYIAHIIYANGPQPQQYLMEMPDARLNLVIELNDKTTNTLFAEANFNDSRTMKHGWVSGANHKAIIYKNNTDSSILSIRFTLGGFYALTKIPMSEIMHPGLEIELILGSSFNKLYQLLINEKDVDLKFKHIESYFQSYIIDNDFETSIVKFIDTNVNMPIDWLVKKSGYSQKHLITILKKQTGFSTKYIQRLQRFQKVIAHIQNSQEPIVWSSLAYQYGYFDQAHFIKEFIFFTGVSPVEHFRMKSIPGSNNIVPDIKLF